MQFRWQKTAAVALALFVSAAVLAACQLRQSTAEPPLPQTIHQGRPASPLQSRPASNSAASQSASTLLGRLSRHSLPLRTGAENVLVPVIELTQPVVYQGKSFDYVQFVLNERELLQWGGVQGQFATVHCSPPQPAYLAPDKYLECQPHSITVEP